MGAIDHELGAGGVWGLGDPKTLSPSIPSAPAAGEQVSGGPSSSGHKEISFILFIMSFGCSVNFFLRLLIIPTARNQRDLKVLLGFFLFPYPLRL